MKLTTLKTLIPAAGLAAMLASAPAAADLRVTAFATATGYQALISGNADAAMSSFSEAELSSLDFTDANNLCVARILVKDTSAATSACQIALEKVDADLSLSLKNEKRAKASIYSNLAVAATLAGDTAGAAEYLELARKLNSMDRNVSNNYSVVSDMLSAQGMAQI